MGHQRARRGANAVEFALILPVLVGLLGAIMDFGLYFSNQQTVQDAVREAARQGTVTLVSDDPASAAITRARSVLQEMGLDADKADIRATVVEDDDLYVDVSIVLPYDAVFSFIPTPEANRAHLSMRMEDQ